MAIHEEEILKRFAKVFEQTYTRFLDLQKAEAQARESQIQLALERVRARTMAMQKSDELSETAVLLFHQLMSLELNVKGCGFNIWEKDEKTCTSWMSGPDGGVITAVPIATYSRSPFHPLLRIQAKWRRFLGI